MVCSLPSFLLDPFYHFSATSQRESIRSIIHRESSDADLAFLELREPGVGDEPAYAERLAQLIGDLPTVILVRSAGQFAGRLL